MTCADMIKENLHSIDNINEHINQLYKILIISIASQLKSCLCTCIPNNRALNNNKLFHGQV